MTDKLHIASIPNISLPTRAQLINYLSGNDVVEFIAIRNHQNWTLTEEGIAAGYTRADRPRGIIPYGTLAINNQLNGLLVEPDVLHDDFLGYEIELLLNDAVVASEFGSEIDFRFDLLNNTINTIYFTLNNNGITVYNIGSIDDQGSFILNDDRFSAFPTVTRFDSLKAYIVLPEAVAEAIVVDPDDPVAPVLPVIAIGESYEAVPELDPYTYASVRDIEFLVGDLVAQRRFKDYIAPSPDEMPPIVEQFATTVTLSQALIALQIGAASTLTDVYPSLPPVITDLILTNAEHLRLRQGLRWCNAYGAAVVLMNSFSREGMPVQSRESRTRINTLLLIYRTWIEKTMRSLTDWPISITPKASVFAIGRDFPRSIQRGDQSQGRIQRPGRGASGTSVVNPR